MKTQSILVAAVLILISGIVLIITLPILLTQYSSCITYDETAAHIGNTIGGTTAPIVGLITAFLAFVAFYEQYRRVNTLEERELERIATDEVRNVGRYIEEFEFQRAVYNDTALSRGPQAWTDLLRQINFNITKKLANNQTNVQWQFEPDAPKLSKLYSLIDICCCRIDILSGAARTRCLTLLKVEIIQLSEMRILMAQMTTYDDELQKFVDLFLGVLQRIELMDKPRGKKLPVPSTEDNHNNGVNR